MLLGWGGDMTVYLIHLEEAVGKAQTDEERAANGLPPRVRAFKKVSRHYIGATADNSAEALHERLHTHYAGHGSKFLAAAREQGIRFTVAKVWPEGDFELERKLKNRKNAPKLCPVCGGECEFVPWEPTVGEDICRDFFTVQAQIAVSQPEELPF